MIRNVTARRSLVAISALALSALVGCGSAALYPGGDNRTVVIGPDGAIVSGTPSGNDCLPIPGGGCIRPQQQCGAGAHAEVVVSADGMVQDIVCFPDQAQSYTVVRDQPTVSTDNKEIVVLDGAVDGPDVIGDLDVTGNNAIVYGQGPGASVVGGNVNVIFNNGIVRGISVLGDTKFIGNNTTFYYCVIYGNVIIESNDNVLSSCDIYGNVTVIGSNNELRALRIQGTLSDRGDKTVCAADVRFIDANLNRIIDPLEVGATLSCN